MDDSSINRLDKYNFPVYPAHNVGAVANIKETLGLIPNNSTDNIKLSFNFESGVSSWGTGFKGNSHVITIRDHKYVNKINLDDHGGHWAVYISMKSKVVLFLPSSFLAQRTRKLIDIMV
jgi:hypothetical protein